VYTELEQLKKVLAGETRMPGARKQNGMSGLMVLHLNFVAKPSSGPEFMNQLAETIENARLDKEGLEASVMLMSDREARLVTLLTFWERSRFLATRKYCIAWMQRLLARFADGTIRAHSSVPQFLVVERSVGVPVRMPETDVSHFREIEIAAD
jgi:hypothetical protein